MIRQGPPPSVPLVAIRAPVKKLRVRAAPMLANLPPTPDQPVLWRCGLMIDRATLTSRPTLRAYTLDIAHHVMDRSLHYFVHDAVSMKYEP